MVVEPVFSVPGVLVKILLQPRCVTGNVQISDFSEHSYMILYLFQHVCRETMMWRLMIRQIIAILKINLSHSLRLDMYLHRNDFC